MARNRLAQFVAKYVPFGVFGDARRMEQQAEALQRKRLKSLIKQAAGTEWGRAHGYEELLNSPDIIRAYQQHVPLQNYADLQSLIQRVRSGEPDVLWPGRFKYFGVSGGTYSTGKVIPASEEMLAQSFQAGAAMTIRYLAQTGNLDALTGAIIPLTGRLFKSDEQPGAVLGNFSGLMTQRHLAQLAEKSKKPHNWFPDTTESLYQEDWEQKLNRMADVTMGSDVRYIALIPTWGLVFFRKLIERYNARHGASATCVRDIWPKLQLVVSGGVALAPYRKMICELVGPDPIDVLETYGAMEAGVIAFQSSLDDGALLLNSGGSFFEFIRYADRDQTNPERFWVGSIEPGQRYIPVISNANGLWAYVLGDVVEFTETRPPKLKVLGRTSEILNQFREALDGDAARKALTTVTQLCGATVVEFHVTYSPADTIAMPCHEWYVEFGNLPPDLQRLSESLDGELRKTCATYDRVRRNSGLAPPRIVTVPTGGLHRALERMGRVLDAQAKVPSMTEGRQLATAIVSETHASTPVAIT